MFHVRRDRKSTRLNSSHLGISYAVVPGEVGSFPTRRSSDLIRLRCQRQPNGDCPAALSRADLTPPDVPCPPRSEEHTSELQSLRHLVCRRPRRGRLFPDTTLFRSNTPTMPEATKWRLSGGVEPSRFNPTGCSMSA